MVKISVLTINYNNSVGLYKTIQSVESQTDNCFEFVIVDGGSCDDSRNIIKNSKRVDKYLSEEDKGIYDAMNKGVKICTGDYVLALNSGDSFFNNDVIKSINSSLKDIDPHVVFGNSIYCYGNEVYDFKWPCAPLNDCLDKWLLHCFPNHQASLIRRDILLETPYNSDLLIFGDGLFWTKILKNGAKFKYIDIDFAFFELGGISNSLPNIKNIKRIILEHAYIKYVSERQVSVLSILKYSTNQYIKFFLINIFGKKFYYKSLLNKQKRKQLKIISNID